MTISSALFLDLALLAILVIAVVVAAKRGFLATILKLCGTALALAAGIVFLMYCSGGSLWLLPAVIGLLGAAAGEIVGNSDFLGA